MLEMRSVQQIDLGEVSSMDSDSAQDTLRNSEGTRTTTTKHSNGDQ